MSPDYPSPATWEYANQRQAARAARSFEQMRQRAIPAYGGPLFVEDDESVVPQQASDVARRVLVLSGVELVAEGVPAAEALALFDRFDLWPNVSPKESEFLKGSSAMPDQAQQFVWRLESLWVLMWALGDIDHLDWPSGMCDVTRLVGLVMARENAEFLTSARVRPVAELLDAQDLILRIHWAIRDAYLRGGGMLPVGLDWTQQDDWIPIHLSAEVGVVEQRHHTLNWLVSAGDPCDWDNVDTPT